MTRPVIENVLAARYASTPMCEIWTAHNYVLLERQLWIAVLKAQRALGVSIPNEAIAAYERTLHEISLEDIKERERRLRHDVMARIESFNNLTGNLGLIHRGLTSRDVTENIQQLQIKQSLKLISMKVAAVLFHLAAHARKYRDNVMAARTHNVAAQPTTLGKRFATLAEELALNYRELFIFMEEIPLRGIKGAVGTQHDMLTVLGGDAHKVDQLDKMVAGELGFTDTMISVGQVYPRSLDAKLVSALVGISAPLSNLALMVRLMAGDELATEGFGKGRAGSSAMPHKMNASLSERLYGFHTLMKGYQNMAANLSGDQWGEGDVSCSVVRRVLFPDALLAMDGMLEGALKLLLDFGAYDAMMLRELNRYLPFLASSRIMMAVTESGGREDVHEIIKRHATEAAVAMRETGADENTFLERLANDDTFPLTLPELQALISKPEEFTGRAARQVEEICYIVGVIVREQPGAVDYRPEPVL